MTAAARCQRGDKNLRGNRYTCIISLVRTSATQFAALQVAWSHYDSSLVDDSESS